MKRSEALALLADTVYAALPCRCPECLETSPEAVLSCIEKMGLLPPPVFSSDRWIRKDWLVWEPEEQPTGTIGKQIEKHLDEAEQTTLEEFLERHRNQ